MKKIGIVTFHRAENYGAFLQVFALSKYLNAYVIDYYCKNIYDQYKIIKPLRKNMLKYIKELVDSFVNFKVVKRRKKKFKDSIDSLDMVPFSDKSIDSFDFLITGSDQVWNPNIVGELSEIYTLNFGSSNTKRISYAASVGNSSYLDIYKDLYISKLKKIDYVSVREKDLVKPLTKMLNKEVFNAIDPTFLISRKEWDVFLPSNSLMKQYIFVYFVEISDSVINAVNKIASENNLLVVHNFMKNPGFIGEVISVYDSGPFDFINYIKNSSYVFTTSFHATAFSIIYNKNFFVVPHKQTGSRVLSLLSSLDLNSQICEDNVDSIVDRFDNFNINWKDVDKLLVSRVNESKKWLGDILNEK